MAVAVKLISKRGMRGVAVSRFLLSWFTLERSLILFSVLLMLALGGIMRVAELDHIPGVNGDEALDAVQIRDLLAGRPTVLKMPTGRLLSPVYGLFLMLFESSRAPDFVSLRLPAVIAGFLVVILLGFFLLTSLSPLILLLFSVLLWVHPINIIYSRVGIEQSLMILSYLWVLYFVLRLNAWGIFIAFVVALLVHPINIFASPFLACAIVGLVYEKKGASYFLPMMAGIFIVMALGVVFEVSVLPSSYHQFLKFEEIGKHLLSFKGVKQFSISYLHLISGITAFEQYASALPPLLSTVVEWCTAIGLGVVFGWGLIVSLRKRRFFCLSTIGGLFLTNFIYYAITGNDAISPGVARYALVLIVPTLFSFVVAWELITEKAGVYLKVFPILIGGGLLLISVGFFFFESIHTNNSSSFKAYFTGPREPKALAYEWISADAAKRGIKNPELIAEDWWTYWPIKYLAIDEPGTQVKLFDKNEVLAATIGDLMKSGAYAVGFSKSGEFEKLFHNAVLLGHLQKVDLVGYGGKPILSIWRIRG